MFLTVPPLIRSEIFCFQIGVDTLRASSDITSTQKKNNLADAISNKPKNTPAPEIFGGDLFGSSTQVGSGARPQKLLALWPRAQPIQTQECPVQPAARTA